MGVALLRSAKKPVIDRGTMKKKRFLYAIVAFLAVIVGFVCACSPSNNDGTGGDGNKQEQENNTDGNGETDDDGGIELPDVDL